MKTNLDFELYLYQMELNFEKLQEGMWVIQDEAALIDNILIVHQPPIVLFRVKLMEWRQVPSARREAFFRRVLELNSVLNHCSFALEGENVVVNGTLQAENLDFNEFQATIDDIIFAVTEYHPELSAFREVSQDDSTSASPAQATDEEHPQ